jgi:hypothetical protein
MWSYHNKIRNHDRDSYSIDQPLQTNEKYQQRALTDGNSNTWNLFHSVISRFLVTVTSTDEHITPLIHRQTFPMGKKTITKSKQFRPNRLPFSILICSSVRCSMACTSMDEEWPELFIPCFILSRQTNDRHDMKLLLAQKGWKQVRVGEGEWRRNTYTLTHQPTYLPSR